MEKGTTFGQIAKEYANFTVSHYGKATVIFDGYTAGPTIKDNEDKRRQQKVHLIVPFTPSTVFLSGKMDEFLSRDCNKQGFISLIGEELEIMGCKVIHASLDADVDIVKIVIRAANDRVRT